MSVTISTDGEKPETASFDALFRSVYDTKFTTDISNRMHMPDRIGAVNNHLFYNEDSPLRSQSTATEILHTMDPSYYMVGTPPRILTAQDAAYSDDEDEDEQFLREYTERDPRNDGARITFTPHNTPQRQDSSDNLGFDAAAVPMTPGTLLMQQSGDDVAVVRRQLGKLISHVRRLEDENARRQQREYFLYPAVVGYFVYQLVKYLMSRK